MRFSYSDQFSVKGQKLTILSSFFPHHRSAAVFPFVFSPRHPDFVAIKDSWHAHVCHLENQSAHQFFHSIITQSQKSSSIVASKQVVKTLVCLSLITHTQLS